jgi:hypothetical protein
MKDVIGATANAAALFSSVRREIMPARLLSFVVSDCFMAFLYVSFERAIVCCPRRARIDESLM